MKIDVKHVAKLANLPLKNDEIEKLESQLEETLEYVARLNEIDTTDINPTSQVTGLENVTREDIQVESLTQEEALSNTNEEHNGLFKVKAILDND
jgi:aspartyl-tRNA(Asn)/glutamyl-tRNA(Gln) amidotransferase subunit C